VRLRFCSPSILVVGRSHRMPAHVSGRVAAALLPDPNSKKARRGAPWRSTRASAGSLCGSLGGSSRKARGGPLVVRRIREARGTRKIIVAKTDNKDRAPSKFRPAFLCTRVAHRWKGCPGTWIVGILRASKRAGRSGGWVRLRRSLEACQDNFTALCPPIRARQNINRERPVHERRPPTRANRFSPFTPSGPVATAARGKPVAHIVTLGLESVSRRRCARL
jgi:hypothetical protein